MAGLNSTLNTASLGLSAQQAALNVTAHNISNANTAGYTRERVDMAAISGANVSMDNSSTNQIGTGVTVTDISRIRDILKDYQVRDATTTKATYATTNNYLTQVQSIMNEPTGTGLSSLIGTFYNAWSSVAGDSASTSNARTTLVEQTKTLTDTLNGMYTQLQKLKADSQTAIKSQVDDVNSKLNQVDNINQNIMAIKSSGSEPNDLLDQRDLLVDKLSESFNVSTSSTTGDLEGITLSTPNATFISPTVTSSENRLAYADISSIKQPTTPGGNDASCTLTYYKNGDSSKPVTLTVTGTSDEINKLDESRVLVTDKDGNALDTSGKPITATGATADSFKTLGSTDGVFVGLTTTQQSIDKYTTELNNVAKSIALTVNTVESGTTVSGKDTNPYFVNSSAATYNTASGSSTLNSAYYTGTNLDTNEAGITAGNISINKEILNDPSKVKTGLITTSAAAPGDGKRALAISQLGNAKIDIQGMTPSATRAYFTANDAALIADSNGIPTLSNKNNGMTTSGYFTNEIASLGTTASEVKSQLTTRSSVLNSMVQARTSESGVSTDEEMANLIQYNHAYQANAKVISTVSNLLDVVIGLVR